MLSVSRKFRLQYLFACVNRYTRYSIAAPFSNTKIETVIEANMLHVVAQFVTAKTCVSDRGGKFMES